MDLNIIAKHWEVIEKHYPGMSVTQLGMVVCLLGGLRATMGHEAVKGTIEDYIHPDELSPNIRQCMDFLEREVLGIKKSRIDIDYWKRGRAGEFRRDKDKVTVIDLKR